MFVKTDLLESEFYSKCCGKKVFLKQEHQQTSNSFKYRGISLLCKKYKEEGKNLIVSSSGGNAGIAAAQASRDLGLECKVFVPTSTSSFTRELLKSMGAEVVVAGDHWKQADTQARLEQNCGYVHPFDEGWFR